MPPKKPTSEAIEKQLLLELEQDRQLKHVPNTEQAEPVSPVSPKSSELSSEFSPDLSSEFFSEFKKKPLLSLKSASRPPLSHEQVMQVIEQFGNELFRLVNGLSPGSKRCEQLGCELSTIKVRRSDRKGLVANLESAIKLAKALADKSDHGSQEIYRDVGKLLERAREQRRIRTDEHLAGWIEHTAMKEIEEIVRRRKHESR